MTSATDLFDRVRKRLGTLGRGWGGEAESARRMVAPSDEDTQLLEIYAGDGIGELAKVTDRLNASMQLTTTPSQEYIDRPEHLDVIDEIAVFDGGTGYDVEIKDGQVVASDARVPHADEGRPDTVGAYEGRLYLYPIPDDEYTIDVQFQMNGAYSDNSPSATDPPLLDTLVDRVPNELERALTAYVTAQWLKDMEEHEAAAQEERRFVRDINRYEDEPIHQSTAEVPYNPLSL